VEWRGDKGGADDGAVTIRQSPWLAVAGYGHWAGKSGPPPECAAFFGLAACIFQEMQALGRIFIHHPYFRHFSAAEIAPVAHKGPRDAGYCRMKQKGVSFYG